MFTSRLVLTLVKDLERVVSIPYQQLSFYIRNSLFVKLKPDIKLDYNTETTFL